jgi:signal transduction histidine kinase
VPDVVVSDVMMPGMSGVELLAEVRRRRPGTRVILVTALTSTQSVVDGLAAGAHDYLRKPFAPDVLVARVRTQAELKRLGEQLIAAEKRALLGTFAAGLAHEVRNPAAAIEGCVEPLRRVLARHLPERPATVDEALDVIREATSRISALVRDVLDLAQVDRAQLRPYQLQDGLSTCLRLLAHRLREPVGGPGEGAAPVVEIVQRFAAVPEVVCQPALINQVLLNVLDNAMHAAGERPGRRGSVTVETAEQDGGVVVRVRDDGGGMDPETLGRAFDPFFTTRPPGRGTGLGLSVSRQIVDAHGGRLSLTSRVGEGTEACLWLPLRPAGSLAPAPVSDPLPRASLHTAGTDA